MIKKFLLTLAVATSLCGIPANGASQAASKTNASETIVITNPAAAPAVMGISIPPATPKPENNATPEGGCRGCACWAKWSKAMTDTTYRVVPYLLGFLIPACLMWITDGNTRFLFDVWQAQMVKGLDDEKRKEAAGKDLYGPTAPLFGKLERLLYVFAVVVWDLEIIVAWVILREFHNLGARTKNRALCDYHIFAGGALISLLLGIAWGVLGRSICWFLRQGLAS